MTSITTSYSDLITKEATDYTKSTPAAALFYWGDGSARGLRIESIELMKEFFDNVDFGRGRCPGVIFLLLELLTAFYFQIHRAYFSITSHLISRTTSMSHTKFTITMKHPKLSKSTFSTISAMMPPSP